MEAMFSFAEAVGGLRHPDAVPFLVHVMGNGNGPMNALADLGLAAFPSVVEAVESADDPSTAGAGFIVLRFMLEDGTLREEERRLTGRAVQSALSANGYYSVIYHAMAAAVVLGDAELVEIVNRFGRDRAFAERLVSRRYVLDYDKTIEAAQALARSLLAGTPPLPRRWRPPERVRRR